MLGFLMDIFDIVSWVFFWYFVIKVVSDLYDAYERKEQVKEKQEEVFSDLQKMLHNVKLEKHNDTHYWFDEETDRFLAQGKNIQEIQEHLKQRFTNDVFLVNEKLMLVGPNFEPIDISNKTADEVGKYIADNAFVKYAKSKLDTK